MYFALSSTFGFLITRELSSVIEKSSPGIISVLSFVQITDGVGTPLTGHMMVMVVFKAAVTLSPMFIVTGLPSPTEFRVRIQVPRPLVWLALRI